MTGSPAYPHIAKHDDKPARLKRFPRIQVADVVLPHLAHGWSADELQRQFSHLTPGEIHSCLGYYLDNPAEVESLIATETALSNQLQAAFSSSGLGRRLRALKTSECLNADEVAHQVIHLPL